MKIALTSEYFYPQTGGAEQSALELATALKGQGNEVVVFTRGPGESDEVFGIQVRRIFSDLQRGTVRRDVPFPRLVDAKEQARLKGEIEGEGFDIIHSNNRDTAVFSAKAGEDLDIPSVAHIRDYWLRCPKRDLLKPEGICKTPKLCGNCMARYFNAWHKVAFYYKMWSDTGYRFQEIKGSASHFVYNSHYTQERIGLNPGSVVYNPIDIASIPKKEKEPGKVLFVGNITKRKGVLELAEAVEDLKITLHIVGDGYLLSQIKGDNIILHGKLDYESTKEHLASSEILVVPSKWPEPFGRVAAEGMAAEVPVIVSPHGGLSEVVGDAALILDEISVSGIRGAITRLQTDDTLRRRLMEKGKKRILEFQPQKIAKEMKGIYEDLLSSQ